MQNSDDSSHHAKLQIFFPKSNEDHRLQLIDINGAIFAILFSALESKGQIRLNCEDWSLILLAPIKSQADVVISAINIICVNDIQSQEGTVSIEASNQLVKITPSIKSSDRVIVSGKEGEFQFDDDPGSFIYYFQLFNKIVSEVRKDDPASFIEAQKKFILCLCALAQKLEGQLQELTIHRVLELWKIPPMIEKNLGE